MPIQSNYETYQSRGFVGQEARGTPPACYETAAVHVPTNGDNIQPGWGVVWDTTEEQFKEPTSDAEQLAVQGIVGMDMTAKTTQLTSIPTGANSMRRVEYADNAVVRVMTEGFMWVYAGGNVNFGDALVFDRADNQWKKLTTPTTIAGLPQLCVTCRDVKGADNDLIEVHVQLRTIR